MNHGYQITSCFLKLPFIQNCCTTSLETSHFGKPPILLHITGLIGNFLLVIVMNRCIHFTSDSRLMK